MTEQDNVKQSGFAVVKAVLSGDSLILASNTTSNAAEKIITLANIAAPRFARTKNAIDEPWAWHSREYLRQRCIGMRVSFTVTYIHEPSGRQYATVMLPKPNNHQVMDDLSEFMVSGGYARTKPLSKNIKNIPTERQKLIDLEQQATEAKLGIWNPQIPNEKMIRRMDYYPDLTKFPVRTPLKAIIEQLRDGSTYRVEIIPDDLFDLNHDVIWFHLAGIQAPKIPLNATKNQDIKNNDIQTEPYALEALNFAEIRLLHRLVHIIILGLDKNNNLFGTIQYNQGNMTHALLSNGLARIVPWSANLTNDVDALIGFENNAKEKRLRIWSNYNPNINIVHEEVKVTNNSNLIPGYHFVGKVIQVLSGDLFLIQDLSTAKEFRVSLSSIKAPKLGRRSQEEQPLAWEARETLRKIVIGKKVNANVDYIRTMEYNGQKEYRPAVSLFQGKVNLAIHMLSLGLAEVLNHRLDEPRSPHYELLLVAEKQAKNNNKGIFQINKPSIHYIFDLTNKSGQQQFDKSEAVSTTCKQYLPGLLRDKKIKAVVEFVFYSSRFKLYIPKQNIYISFILAGIKTPAITKDGKEGNDELSNEATNFIRSLCLQHDVMIEVVGLDKGDNFLGVLTMKNNINVAMTLVEKGYASVLSGPAIDRLTFSQELLQIESMAKSNKKGIWKNETTEPETEEQMIDSTIASNTNQYNDILQLHVCDISSGIAFHAHTANNPNISIIQNIFSQLIISSQAPDDFQPKKNETVLAKFTDGQWHRAKLGNKVDALYRSAEFSDFGNVATICVSDMRPLPTNLSQIPPLAIPCYLAGCKAPSSHIRPDWFEDSFSGLANFIWGNTMYAKVVHSEYVSRSVSKIQVVLYTDSEHAQEHPKYLDNSVNAMMLSQGLVRIDPNAPISLSSLIESLQEFESNAKQYHYNIWQYGDISDDDSN